MSHPNTTTKEGPPWQSWLQTTTRPEQLYVGVDIGKVHHWVCVVAQDGTALLSIKVGNDEAEINNVITAIAGSSAPSEWAVDIIGAPSALLLALQVNKQQPG